MLFDPPSNRSFLLPPIKETHRYNKRQAKSPNGVALHPPPSHGARREGTMIPSLPHHRLPRLSLGLYTVISRLVIQGCPEGPQEVPVSGSTPQSIAHPFPDPFVLSKRISLWILTRVLGRWYEDQMFFTEGA